MTTGLKSVLALCAVLALAPPLDATCYISRACGDGNNVQCSGTFNCQYTLRGVSCNGNEVPCPNFCEIGMYCQECHQSVFCFSTAGNCQEITGGISCDGSQIYCHETCPDIPNGAASSAPFMAPASQCEAATAPAL